MEMKPGYKQTEVGVIPEDWEPRGLLSAVSIAKGQVDPRKEPYRSMVLVAPDHIESGTGKLLAKRTAAEQRAISGKYVFGAGDIVYSKIRPYLKKAVLAEFAGLCSADMYPLRPADGVVGGYMLSVLLGHRFTKYAESVSVRSGMPKINRAELADFAVALPPPAEQRAIAAALSDVDTLLGGLDRLIAKKRDLKHAAMRQLLTGQTRLPGFHDEWEATTMRDVLTHKATYGIVTAGAFVQSGVKMVRGGDIFEGRINTELPMVPREKAAEYGRTMLIKDDVVIALVGYPGAAAKIPSQLIGANISRAVGLLRLNGSISADFLVCFLNSPDGRRMFLAPSAGSAQQVVNLSALNKLRFAVPALPEQSAIAAVLSDMDTELAALEARRKKTRALKQGMMQELLTGKTRLVAPSSNVAAVDSAGNLVPARTQEVLPTVDPS